MTRGDDDCLDGTARIVGRITLGDCIPKQRCCVGLDYHSGIGMFIVNGLAHGRRIIVEVGGGFDNVAQVVAVRLQDSFGRIRSC